MNQISAFNPNWASPPGDTIADVLRAKRLSRKEFSERLCVGERDADRIIQGFTPIDEILAKKLEEAIGGTANFWINRETMFREAVERLKDVEEQKWSKELPVSDMIRFGWIHSRNTKNLLEYFDTPNIWTWKRKYESYLSTKMFRKTDTYESEIGALAAWEREGEILANKINVPEWNKVSLQNSLERIKLLSRKIHQKSLFSTLQEICLKSGLIVLFVPPPKGCSASGLAKFTDSGNPLILLSLRYYSDDQFWFTFFHEIGHVLLHSERDIFIDENIEGSPVSKEESEANQFATDTLIPKSEQSELLQMTINGTEIKRAANRCKVSCGIIVGQLQHLKRIPFDKFNAYKSWFKKSEFYQN